MEICATCGVENSPRRKFCGGCGALLTRTCPACGTANEPGARFCGECGVPLEGEVAPAAVRQAPVAERRLVSVLFADLVGFTSASEGRDAEETRELLTRYFDTCRTVIERYGGTVEKFIGDAVMAVWGTPVAQEDDAERAVRAALDLVAAISDLAPGVRVRAGVLTGEAAVTIGAAGQGMVAGDIVNTASRIQSAAEPGSVLVGEATKRATEAAIAYAAAAEHQLKGKTEAVATWQALRVTAGRRGALKSAGLEAPFVGRDRELRLVKELFHVCAGERRAHLVSVVGIAGIGKSRLGWEFEKYIDGLAEDVWWHRGRCLAYGEGVAFWALAEMVRMRAQITEGEDAGDARRKLQAALADYVPDAEERRFVEPRLAHLLGLDEGATYGRDELFGAWRLLFERMSDTKTVVLLFEDLQWADATLVEFITHLLEWSRNHPIYVLCQARPELQERNPGFGSGSRNQTALFLEPLSSEAMKALLDGFAPGLPAELREQILGRAEGVPLYAVETVRMLLDRGLLVQEGPIYRPTDTIEELEVPETLQGLIAARLDGLDPEERRLLQDASVLGKTFSREALAALVGLAESELEPLLSALVRKEILGVQADPRSPERGQYGFLQDLVKRVAYGTLARRERKARHLAAAALLQSSFGESEREIVEVVASHYLAAYEVQPDAEDAAAIRSTAGNLLAQAGERAGSLAAVPEARRYYEQAAGLADDPLERARLLDHAGRMAFQDADLQGAEALFTAAHELLAPLDTHAAATVSARIAQVEQTTGRGEEGHARLEAAFAAVADDEPDDEIIDVASRLGQSYAFSSHYELAREPTELALRLSQALRLPEPLIRGLHTKAMLARASGRPEEHLALLRHALRLALEHDLTENVVVSYANLSDACFFGDRYSEALDALADALVLARRVGSRNRELFILAETSYALAMSGRWQDALAIYRELPADQLRTNGALASVQSGVLEVLIHQGRSEEARTLIALPEYFPRSAEPQDQAIYAGARTVLFHAEGRYQEAFELGAEWATRIVDLGAGQQGVKQCLVWAIASALALGENSQADALLSRIEELPPGLRPPFLEAQAHRFRVRMNDEEAGFKTAAAGFREYNFPFWLAVTELEHGEWLVRRDRAADAEPLLQEARAIFERLEAKPWLERAARVDLQPADISS
ncbi:MAG TPA: adenylate/guanylate cyclase domain-containing protein [Gaiellaceae bacterium]|nr:adenylate/guanylate cyclase domain-containing protein [Gaiellaceae bacterium]